MRRRSTWLSLLCLGIAAATALPVASATGTAGHGTPDRLVTITIPSHGLIPARWLDYPGPPRADVLLPDNYNPHQRYPLVLNLGGLGGDYADAAFGTGMHIDAIVVTPEPGNGWYADWWNNGRRGDPAWETYYLDDVLPTVLARYPILPQRRFHAIVGISMGGLGATYLGGRLPGFFGSVASLSGFVDPQFFGVVTEQAMGWTSLAPFKGNTDLYAVYGPPNGFYATGHNPTRLVDNLRQTRVFATTGTGVPSQNGVDRDPAGAPPAGALEGTIIRPMNDAFHAAARAAGVDLTYRVHPGGHYGPDFSKEISAWLAWGPFKPVTTHPRFWTNRTVATEGRLWGIRYRFARAPSKIVRFARSGRSLTITAAGSPVTITTSGGCAIHAATPATLHIPTDGVC